MLPPMRVAPCMTSGQMPTALAPTLNSPPASAAWTMYLMPEVSLRPVSSTLAVATPSGNCSLVSTISERRSGIVNSTPSSPPNPAMSATQK